MDDGRHDSASDPRFPRLIEESAAAHGHLCPGQVLGVRMALVGMREAGINDPRGRDRKNIIVFVEMDRCAADAIHSATGCSLGKRTLKFMDYGKMAATFLNLSAGKAVRVVAREEARQAAQERYPGIPDKYQAQLEAYKVMKDHELFLIMEVQVSLKPGDMPGRPLQRVICHGCGEHVQDMREVRRDGAVLCSACAEGGYYTLMRSPLPRLLPHRERVKEEAERYEVRRGFFQDLRYAKKT